MTDGDKDHLVLGRKENVPPRCRQPVGSASVGQWCNGIRQSFNCLTDVLQECILVKYLKSEEMLNGYGEHLSIEIEEDRVPRMRMMETWDED